MASRFILPFADVGSGIKPASGAQLFFFAPDGVTPKATFTDSAATIPNSNPEIEDAESIDATIETPPSIDKLNNIVGGTWWQDILKSSADFPKKVNDLSNGVCHLLSRRFKEVCKHSLKALPHHSQLPVHLNFRSTFFFNLLR